MGRQAIGNNLQGKGSHRDGGVGCRYGYITSSSTLTTCPASLGSGPPCSAGRFSEREREVVIGPEVDAPVGMCFMPVSDRKRTKNRLHLDLTTDAADREAEIERIIALGARRVDVGQRGDESWVVLADPEGNEFCVVRPKSTLID